MLGSLVSQMGGLTLQANSQTVYKPCMGSTSSLQFKRPNAAQVFKSRTPLKVVAARVAGVEIPNNKHAEYSIQYVFGIGPTRAKDIIAATGLEGLRIRELSEEQLTKLREQVEKYSIEGDLRRFNAMNIRRLKEIQCYRGRRHIMNLPVRGQRTKTNARTRKGSTLPHLM